MTKMSHFRWKPISNVSPPSLYDSAFAHYTILGKWNYVQMCMRAALHKAYGYRLWICISAATLYQYIDEC